jgi:hypothetical protein
MREEDGSQMDVQCGDRNLTSVPSASGNDILVVRLNLSYNALYVLTQVTLQGYESAKYVYLQHCKLESIGEKTFWYFENLRTVYLSNNFLISMHPYLFARSHLLEKLILRHNDLSTLQPNTSILYSSSLAELDLQSCELKSLSSETFLLLPNLQALDIRGNKLAVLNPDTLSSNRQLKYVKIDKNEWKCGDKFEALLCWMHSKLVGSHNNTIGCEHENKTRQIWTPAKQSSLCGPVTSPSQIEFHQPDVRDSTTVNSPVACLCGPDTRTLQLLESIRTKLQDGTGTPQLSTSDRILLYIAIPFAILSSFLHFLTYLKRICGKMKRTQSLVKPTSPNDDTKRKLEKTQRLSSR